MDARTHRLLHAPIGPTLLRLAAPNVVVMLVQALVGLIETAFVAGLGTDALAGMALVFPVLMLVQMISAGAMGGGILSAVARSVGAGRRKDADALPWYAAAIALVLGLFTTVLDLAYGPALYRLMGGEGASLAAATTYGGVVFAGAALVWLFNALAAVIRGTGNMALPAIVISIGAAVLVPLSPALIYGFGPIPGLGIVGGGVAVLAYYAAGTVVFVHHLWAGRGLLRPSRRPPRLAWAPLRDILRIGAVSSIVSATTNVTIAAATAFAGAGGPAAVAGYGTGARLEYLLVPLVFGLGAPIGAMVGTCIGAGDRARALRVAWTGAAIAGGLTEAIGLAAALWPLPFLGLFGHDPQMLAVGARYLHLVGPFYGFAGIGLALYFASQGAGRVGWPLVAGLARMAVSIGGGLIALRLGLGLDGVFLALGFGLAALGLINAGAVAAGAWFRGERVALPALAAAGGE
ncbi:MATE family efflux transporter [Methylobacterium terricola]|uniref:MATE family efflux transporter n=1 Tax=Methylobacterium terricola TaxID=2583531 RepID=A0A5C4LIL8_9HYPH|nr:MATE family efflux transporter [Methylobacterium terricola]TNC12008.1 MATE family efflux transporter [Methylobacterium terricola]